MQKNIFIFFIISIILCSNIGFAQSFNGHEYVDLGLPSGTKWAKCNIGAKTETDYGYYFAWGETKAKNSFSESNYNYEKQEVFVDSDGFTHKRDNTIVNISGNPKYDAATANWGKDWCMPTEEQFEELIYNCNWEWVGKNGINGYKVTGNNGKYIFFPASGCRLWSDILNVGHIGDYWSSSIDKNISGEVYHLYFLSSGPGTDVSLGYYGYSVRPVYASIQEDNIRINPSVESQALEDTAPFDSKDEITVLNREKGLGEGADSGSIGGSIGNRKVTKVLPENKDNMTGTVKLKITVNEKGIVETAEPISGTTCDECVPFTIKAVQQWKYEAKPGSGTQTGIVTVEFKLK